MTNSIAKEYVRLASAHGHDACGRASKLLHTCSCLRHLLSLSQLQPEQAMDYLVRGAIKVVISGARSRCYAVLPFHGTGRGVSHERGTQTPGVTIGVGRHGSICFTLPSNRTVWLSGQLRSIYRRFPCSAGLRPHDETP